MDNQTFLHLCKLSKLTFSPEEHDALIADMSEIVALMDKVKEADLFYDDEKDGGAITLSDLRPDIAGESFERDLILRNTSAKRGCYAIPRLME